MFQVPVHTPWLHSSSAMTSSIEWQRPEPSSWGYLSLILGKDLSINTLSNICIIYTVCNSSLEVATLYSFLFLMSILSSYVLCGSVWMWLFNHLPNDKLSWMFSRSFWRHVLLPSGHSAICDGMNWEQEYEASQKMSTGSRTSPHPIWRTPDWPFTFILHASAFCV